MKRLGIIAGGGNLPKKLIEACQANNTSFFVLALKGQADEDIIEDVPHKWIKLGATTEAIRILKSEGVDTVVMAGFVRRPSLTEIKPDLRTLGIFARLGVSGFGDDALLRTIAEELEKDGLSIIGAHEVDPSLIMTEGCLTKKFPSPENEIDLEHGIKIVKILGQLDVGQAVVVQQCIVLGLECVEGTDALLKRCGDLKRKGHGGVLVKGSKPQQDKRLDLPTIGLKTLQSAHEAGLEGIAIEAGKSILLDKEKVIETANKMGLFIKGFTAP